MNQSRKVSADQYILSYSKNTLLRLTRRDDQYEVNVEKCQ